MRINNEPTSVSITISGGVIGITQGGKLTIGPDSFNKEGPRYDLGEATTANIDAIISYFNRLKIHATDAP